MAIEPEKIASIIASARIILLPTILSEIDFKYSTKESENKESECIFCNGTFYEDEQREIWITFGSKIIRALAIILASGLFLQANSSHLGSL